MVLPNIEPTHGDPDYLGKTATFHESYANVTIPIIQDSMVLPNIEPTHGDPDYLGKNDTFPESYANVTITIWTIGFVIHLVQVY